MRNRLIPRTPLNLPILVLLVMAGVSLLATFDVRVSAGKVAGLAIGTGVFWAVTRWIDTRARLDTALTVFVVTGATLAAVGLLAVNWIDKFPMFSAVIASLPRAIRGLPGAERGVHPNEVAGCLVLFVPLQIAFLVERTRRRTAVRRSKRIALEDSVHMLALVLTTGTLALTQSRGAWAGLVVAAVAFLVWHNRTTRTIAAVCVAGVLALALQLGPPRVIDFTISQSGPGMASNVSGRRELWSRALDGIRDFPFTGMGMNVFRKAMPVLYPTSLTTTDIDVAHAHNHLLQAALDLGIPGLIAYLSIWMIAAALLVSVYRRSPERMDRAIAGGVGAGLIAHFTFGMTDAVALGSKGGVVFWLTLAIAVAVHRVSVTKIAIGAPAAEALPPPASPPYAGTARARTESRPDASIPATQPPMLASRFLRSGGSHRPGRDGADACFGRPTRSAR